MGMVEITGSHTVAKLYVVIKTQVFSVGVLVTRVVKVVDFRPQA
jgi:hypothetical protein